MKSLDEIRNGIKVCRNTDNIGCVCLTQYRDRTGAEGADHPILFQIVPKAKIMVIGPVPGPIEAGPAKAAYQRLVRGQFSLGHKSAQGLGEIMMRVGQIKNIDLPADITRFPGREDVQKHHSRARQRLGLHVTNLVKCQAPRSWETNETATWTGTAEACERRHLAHEISVIDPSMVVLLGKRVADYFSRVESWGLEGNRCTITAWVRRANYLPFYGKNRFVTAWIHPGGTYFWIQGRGYWDMYAKQLADSIG